MTISMVATVRAPQRAVEVNISKAAPDVPGALVRVTPYGEQPARVAWLLQTDLSWVAYDYEVPLDVPVSYRIDAVRSNDATLASNGSDWWVALGAPAQTRPVTVESFPALSRPLGHAIVQPLIRRNPIPVIAARRGATGVLTLITLSLEQARGMVTLIDSSPLFLFNGPPAHGLGSGLYLLAADYEERRWITYAEEPARLFAIQVREVDRPPLDVVVPKQNTWAEWALDDHYKWTDWRQRRHLDILTEEGVP